MLQSYINPSVMLCVALLAALAYKSAGSDHSAFGRVCECSFRASCAQDTMRLLEKMSASTISSASWRAGTR